MVDEVHRLEIRKTGEPHYVGKFDLRPVLGRKWWQKAVWVVQHDLAWVDADGIATITYAGDITDLASIPRLVHPIFSPAGPWMRAAVTPHDKGCKTHTVSVYDEEGICVDPIRKMPRSYFDKQFVIAMKLPDSHTPKLIRSLFYCCVRAQGIYTGGKKTHAVKVDDGRRAST